MVLKVLGETYFFLDPYKAGKKNQPLQTTTEQLQCRERSQLLRTEKNFPFLMALNGQLFSSVGT